MLDEVERICDRVGILKTKLLAVGPPEKLRQSLWGRKTVVQLERVNDAIVAAVKKVAPENAEVVDNKLVIDVVNPEKENPDIVDAIGAVGGRIQFVSAVSPTLEDVYLKLVRS
jgi:ABC-2 type transport system ATP-binding protein